MQPTDRVMRSFRDLRDDERDHASMDQGYTYFGQFLSHELVAPSDPECAAAGVPVSHVLNLDSVYGPAGDRTWAAELDASGRFAHSGSHSREWDLPRDAAGVALVPEQRNDENVIVAQFHRLVQKVHDALISRDEQAFPDALRDERVGRVRSLCCRLFQLLTVEDFLPQVISEEVYKDYFFGTCGWRPVFPPSEHVPDVFSKAIYRFGHSLVRRGYVLNNDGDRRTPQEIELADLLRGKEKTPITAAHRIDWSFFFGVRGNTDTPKASQIDTTVTADMWRVPQACPMAPGPEELSIAKRNLQRGAELPGGTHLLGELLDKPLPVDLHDTERFPRLREMPPVFSGELRDLPLWAYVLMEAQAADGQRLGTLGSVVLAEVFRSALVELIGNGPYDFVRELSALGPLGKELMNTAYPSKPRQLPPVRRFCVSHVIKTLGID